MFEIKPVEAAGHLPEEVRRIIAWTGSARRCDSRPAARCRKTQLQAAVPDADKAGPSPAISACRQTARQRTAARRSAATASSGPPAGSNSRRPWFPSLRISAQFQR